MTTRVMLDIETLGIEPGAAICSIGACTFDTEGVGKTFEVSVDIESCQERGLEIDADTLKWWLTQDEAARGVLTGGVPLATALSELRDFLDTNDYDELWANSPKFDMAHLEAAYDALGLFERTDGYAVLRVGSLNYPEDHIDWRSIIGLDDPTRDSKWYLGLVGDRLVTRTVHGHEPIWSATEFDPEQLGVLLRKLPSKPTAIWGSELSGLLEEYQNGYEIDAGVSVP